MKVEIPLDVLNAAIDRLRRARAHLIFGNAGDFAIATDINDSLARLEVYRDNALYPMGLGI